MAKGDIILITFPFTDLSGNKLRPSTVLADFNQDIIVAFITTQLKWQEQTDQLLTQALHSGIKKPSLIRLSKLATLDKSLIKGRMGSLTIEQIKSLR
ncbi:MAG: type II toxin-antitoxin system PemK/MazF family toxin [Chitinophagales bacterium]|nr:type II toxin-antitoxin system PemK/MazF family toxin [Chitinophagales bacterium]